MHSISIFDLVIVNQYNSFSGLVLDLRMPATRNQANNPKKFINLNIEGCEIRSRLQEILGKEDYETAYEFISAFKPSTPSAHWYGCIQAKIQIELGDNQEALDTLQKLILMKDFQCKFCLSRFLQILKKNPVQNLAVYSEFIYKAISMDRLKMNVCNKEFYKLLYRIYEGSQKNELVESYRRRGSQLNGMGVMQIRKDYRITIATKRIKPNENILFIPKKQLITLERCEKLKEIKHIQKLLAKVYMPKHIKFAIFILLQQKLGPKSKFYHYIHSLPKSLIHFPFYYGQELLQELKGTDFLFFLIKRKQQLQQQFQIIQSKIKEVMPDITFEKFAYAKLLAGSRIFGVTIMGKKTDALIPLADMLNHSTKKMTSWYYSDARRGFLIDNRDNQIEAGQQIFDEYGEKCNSRFLYYYGFTLPDNPHNQVSLTLLQYRSSEESEKIIRLTKKYTCIDLLEALQFYRFQILKSQEEAICRQEEVEEKKSYDFISMDIEAEVWRCMRLSLKSRISLYNSSSYYDEKILRNLQSGPLRECILIRVGEMKILQFFLSMSIELQDYFRRPEKSDREQMKKYEDFFKVIGHTPKN